MPLRLSVFARILSVALIIILFFHALPAFCADDVKTDFSLKTTTLDGKAVTIDSIKQP